MKNAKNPKTPTQVQGVVLKVGVRELLVVRGWWRGTFASSLKPLLYFYIPI
jgi:hypothetical protein